MSETAIVAAFFKSVCPGAARTMRAELAKVTVRSEPLSMVRTTELLFMDLTVPTAFATGVWADAETSKESRTTPASRTWPALGRDLDTDLVTARSIAIPIINSIMRFGGGGVKNCQMRVKVVRKRNTRKPRNCPHDW